MESMRIMYFFSTDTVTRVLRGGTYSVLSEVSYQTIQKSPYVRAESTVRTILPYHSPAAIVTISGVIVNPVVTPSRATTRGVKLRATLAGVNFEGV